MTTTPAKYCYPVRGKIEPGDGILPPGKMEWEVNPLDCGQDIRLMGVIGYRIRRPLVSKKEPK